jgi:hypothetical protein
MGNGHQSSMLSIIVLEYEKKPALDQVHFYFSV